MAVEQAQEPEKTIEVQNLSKIYGNFEALRDVSFEVKKGEILGFLGPNGAGKTTTMRILTGFMPPSSGTARVAGYDIFSESLKARKRIGYLPESVPLYTEMTVYDYLDFAARLRDVPHRDTAIERAMEMTNLGERADTLIGKLSKGFRQRVGIAQALVHEPEVLIMDEPTIGLDPKQIIEVRNLIKSLGGEHTVILSTHILPEVSQTCTRVLIINDGKIVAEDTPARLTARVRGAEHIFLQVAKPAPEIPSALEKVQGVLGVQAKDSATGTYEIETTLGTDRRADIATMAVQKGWGLLELRPVGMSLEEVFLKLTTEESEQVGQ
ncbi:MAG: ABC transporter ATP-binding protein [Chloroflexi bacterium]|nr:ABC transporter ATP-binding protein [Chloroflexota bacterium]MCL5951428.1 ABC transporter ATP-binding protein [Chloroflexota bacterium]